MEKLKLRKAKYGGLPLLGMLFTLVALCGGTAQAAPQYVVDCTTCHQMPPRDSRISNPSKPDKKDPFTGAVPGNHQAHATAAVASCAKCHGAGVTSYLTNHRNKTIELDDALGYGRKQTGVFMNQTSVPPVPMNGCSTAACHSNGKGVKSPTPSWGSAAFQAPGDCNQCHGAAPNTGRHPVAGAKHAAYFGTGTDSCVKCHADHVNDLKPFSHATSAGRAIDVHFTTAPNTGGSFDSVGGNCSNLYCHSDGKGNKKAVSWTGTLDCKGCHGSDSAPDFTSAAGEPNYVSGGKGTATANSHKKHVTAVTDCVKCHSATTDAAGAISDVTAHVNGTINVVNGGGKTFTIDGSKNCSNISCHSGNGIVQNVATAQWGDTLGCAGCHGDETRIAGLSDAHAKHVIDKGYTCDNCHNLTVNSSKAIIGPSYHANSAINVAGSTITNFNADTCATSCHGSATPNWATKANSACGSCHAVLPANGGLIATNAHTAHFTAAYGPAMTQDLTACQTCHVYTTDTASTHVNGSVNVGFGGYNNASHSGTCTGCHNQTITWTGGRIACESCHTGAVSHINSDAPAKDLAATAGHGKSGIGKVCTDCHNANAAHIGAGSSEKRLRADRTACSSCHDDVTARTMQVHLPTADTCAACHDPHGTANSHMVQATLNGTAVSFDGSNFVNAQGTGVCQACHTGTTFYKKGVLETNHETSNCLDCHAHNSPTGTAFEPNRACDSCHGYPPAPRMVAGGAAFVLPTDGTWANTKFENYSGGGGAHLVAAHIADSVKLVAGMTTGGAKEDEAWAPCLICHNGGKAAHAKAIPLRNHVDNVTVSVDPKYRFSDETFIVYTSAKLLNGGANKTGSCFNVSCHISTSPKWSLERY